MQRLLIGAGVLLIVLGALWPILPRLGLGHLPLDIRVQRQGFSFYFPLGTCILISAVLSLVLMLISWFWRR